ncbi:Pol Polyprotein [Phytophthora megakarya]|uniref:Pol Polyprotein n=1 Tax=Phytophthora megakarya TaxID=4795 RepID=A0A225VY77_9STRA|nr:Pol Polyprotein [Phytophthora megakarya]
MTGVRYLGPTEVVKYLGILFGQNVSNEQLLAQLNARFYRFVVWGRRARTYQGRLLLVHTVTLSTLWHFTPRARPLLAEGLSGP